MEFCTLLAQAAQQAGENADIDIVKVDLLWQRIVELKWFHAVLGVSFGMVYMLYGWRIFKILVVIAFALSGLGAGIIVGQEFGSEIWGGVIGLSLLAFISVPLMKYCVGILGAVAGGVLTGGLWYAFELPQRYLWAGGVIGIVAGGMISFIVFRIAVMLFTSLGGSALVVAGILNLLNAYEKQVVNPPTVFIEGLVLEKQWFLPIALLIPTLIGIGVQNKLIKHADKWKI